MNILGNSIKQIRKSKKLTQKDLAQLTGFKQNTISNHENGNRKLDENDIRIYANALNISPQELFNLSTPNSQPTTDTSSQATDELVTAINDKVVQLTTPNKKSVLRFSSELLEQQNTVKYSTDTVEEQIATYYTYNYYDQPASAGTGQYLNDVQVEQIELPIKVNADFVVPIYGDSMEPEYQSGDYVFVKPSVSLSNGDIGVFEYCGDAYIKQLLINENGAFLHSLNSSKYDDIPIDADSDFRIIGEVVDVYREG